MVKSKKVQVWKSKGSTQNKHKDWQRDGGSIPTDPKAYEPKWAAEIQLPLNLRLDPKQLLPSSPKKKEEFAILISVHSTGILPGDANLSGWRVLTYKKSGVKTCRSGLVVTRMIV